jgi:hypothetical protein
MTLQISANVMESDKVLKYCGNIGYVTYEKQGP